MSDSLKTISIKNIDKVTLYTVSGFIRESQTLLPSNNAFYHIPLLVEHICINYYWIAEYFTVHGNGIQLNDKNNIAKNNGYLGFNSVYGNVDVSNSSMIYTWTFKASTGLAIGIDSSNKSCYNDDFTDGIYNDAFFYSYLHNGYKYAHDLDVITGELAGDGWIEGDIIRMELNSSAKTLIFFVNNKDQAIYNYINFDNKTKYTMAASLDFDSNIEIINFDHVVNVQQN